MAKAPERLTHAQRQQTLAAIASVQLESGAIPWFTGGRLDPWDHVEAAMALDVGRLHDRAERAYLWLAATQRHDGAWYAAYPQSQAADRTLDANFCAYCAVGVWHHFLTTGDRPFLERMWPVVEAAIEFALALQDADGTISWARDTDHRPWPRPLLTSCACIYLSIRCAVACADALGIARVDWELAAADLCDAITGCPTLFEDKSRFAMDWYYPILGGAVTGAPAAARIAESWELFVAAGRGCRCVADRPWVTAGETSELALALVAIGDIDRARALAGWVQHLRAEDGSYWTGATFPDGTVWPRERPTWGSGAVVLMDDTLYASGPTFEIFTGISLLPTVSLSAVRDPLQQP